MSHPTHLVLTAAVAVLWFGAVGCAAGGEDATTGRMTDAATATGSGGSAAGGSAAGGSAVGGAASGGSAAGGSAAGGSATGGAAVGGSASGGSASGGSAAGGAGGVGGMGGGGGAVEDPPGTLVYDKILNNSIVDSFNRVRWHSSGAFALLLGAGGKLVRYDAGAGVTLVDTLGIRVDDIEIAANGSYFLVVGRGNDGVGRLWRVSVDAGLNLTVTEELTLSLGEPRAIARSSSDVWAIGAYSSLNISYLYLWEDGLGLTVTKGYNAGAGLSDVMWGDPGPLASDVVHISHGAGNADSKTYVVSTDLIVSNNWSLGFGNPGGAGWRPGGTYGYFTATTTNKIYLYDGGWASHTLPGVGTAASPQAVAWNTSGSRALIVGRAIGPGLSATVIDHRAGASAAFSVADLVYQSIPNFDLTPWFGNSSTYLNDADWRPATQCAEGLIAADDNGTSLNPTFGLLVRFHDTSDPDCP